MLNKLKEKIIKEQFEPGLLGLFTNPFYISRRGLFENITNLAPDITGQALDVGCGTKPYEKYFSHVKYVGLEFDTGINSEKKKADYYYDGDIFPFKDAEFDSVITFQVLEHVFTPHKFLKEINRVLKTGGKLLLSVPFIWDEHEQPFDNARYSSFGLNSILSENGFEIDKHIKSVKGFQVIVQLVNGYLYKITHKNKILKRLTIFFLMPIVNLLGTILSKILPDNEDLYLDNIVLAQKVKNV